MSECIIKTVENMNASPSFSSSLLLPCTRPRPILIVFGGRRRNGGRNGIRDEERSGGRGNEGSICLSSDYNVQVMSPAAVAVVGRYVKKYICWMDGSHAHSVQMPESKLRQYKCGHVTFTEIGLQAQHIVPKGPISQKVVTVKTDSSHISFGYWRSKIYSF